MKKLLIPVSFAIGLLMIAIVGIYKHTPASAATGSPAPQPVTFDQVLSKTDHTPNTIARTEGHGFGLDIRHNVATPKIKGENLLKAMVSSQPLVLVQANKIHIEFANVSGILKGSIDPSIISRDANIKFDPTGRSIDTPIVLITFEGVHLPQQGHSTTDTSGQTWTAMYDASSGDFVGGFS